MELESVENNVAIYKENGQTITVIREFSDEKIDLSMLIDALVRIVESRETSEKYD